MEGDLEIRPRADCVECGRRVAPPVGPSFVYGIGAVGFQSCAACGARWRCMWREPKRGLLSVRALVLVVVALLTLAAGAVAYASSRSSNEPELAAATRGAELPGPASEPSAAGERYRAVVVPANDAKADLQQFLAYVPPATPQREIDRRVAEYAAVARRADAALEDGPWPANARTAVRQLVAADIAFTGELARNAGRLNEPAYSARLVDDAAAVRAAANRVRAALGLPVVAAPRDPRFAPL